MKTNFEYCIVGGGPSGLFCALQLLKNGVKGNDILLFDKGNSLSTRSRKEVVNGIGGAGAYSDNKLSVGLDVGGNIPWLKEEEFNNYTNQVLDFYNQFKPEYLQTITLEEDKTPDVDLKSLKWLHHKTKHIGSDVGETLYLNIEKYLKQQGVYLIPRVTVDKNITVNTFKNVDEPLEGWFNINCTKLLEDETTQIHSFKIKNLFIAEGQRGNIVDNLKATLNLETMPKPYQLGIRVEDERNEVYNKFIEANYDFKIYKTYEYKDGVSVRVRTFCCNSGCPRIAKEDNEGKFISFNGEAYKMGEPNNKVNYGLIAEVTGLPKMSKEEQFELYKKINKYDNFKFDNTLGVKLLDTFKESGVAHKNIKENYPEVVQQALCSFVHEFSKVVDLSKAVFYYPEVKINTDAVKVSEYFETSVPNLFIIGDGSAYTRGIVKAAYTGMKAADKFLV